MFLNVLNIYSKISERMALTLHLFILFLWIGLLINGVVFGVADEELSRKSFPGDFLFGAASSAYQYEGAWNEDGKGPSIWDSFTSQFPEKVYDSNGDVAGDFYHRYKEDIKMMKYMGIDIFRLSISWSRILPNGKISGGVNHLGIQFYNDLIDKLVSNGIKPVATIFQWDTPQVLEDDYGGFLSINIVEDFREYADLCFRLFGDRIKYWITVNEPRIFSLLGYAKGTAAPGRCSNYIGNCTAGDSATEPYLVTHHLLLSHASTFRLYHRKYKEYQQGVVGLTVKCDWMVPYNETQANVMAASRAFDFASGWILEPVILGDYPKIMRALVGKRLPYFTEKQRKMVKGSFDFIGVNYYSGYYAEDDPSEATLTLLSYTTDSQAIVTSDKDGIPIGEPTGWSDMCVYPQGLGDVLHYMMEKYDNPPMIITENGMADFNNLTQTIEEAVEDYERIRYHHLHLQFLQRALRDGANVRGYLVWSFMDDFEWGSGFTLRFGFIFVDRNNNLTRINKLSATWYKDFLGGETTSVSNLLTNDL